MSALLREQWSRQPGYKVGIDWSNPITRGLIFAAAPTMGVVDVRRGIALKNSGSMPLVATPVGRAWRSGAGKYLDVPNGVATFTQRAGGVTNPGMTFLFVGVIRNGPGNNEGRLLESITPGDLVSDRIHVYADGTLHWFDTGLERGLGTINVAGLNAPLICTRGGQNDTRVYRNGRLVGSVAAADSWTAFDLASIAGSSVFPVNNFVDVDTALAAVWSRKFSPGEAIALSENPWQIFQAGRVVTEVPLAPPAPTYARPASDITTQWDVSTGTEHFAVLDETVSDTADYIVATSAGLTDEIKLAAMSTPQSGTSLTVRYTVSGVSAGGSVTVSLRSGASTNLKTDTTRTANGTYTMTVTSAEYAGADFSDLRLRYVSA